MTTTKRQLGAFRGLNNVVDPVRLTTEWAVQADNVDLTQTNGLIRCRGFTQATTNFAITGAYATQDLKRLYVVDQGELRQYAPGLATYTVLKSGLTSDRVWFEEVNGAVFYSNGTDFGCIHPSGWRNWGVPTPAMPHAHWVSGSLPQGRYQILCTYQDAFGVESGGSIALLMEGAGQINVTDIPITAGYTTNVYVTMQNGTVFYLLKENAIGSISYNSEANLGPELTFVSADLPRGNMIAYFQGRLYCAEPYPSLDSTAIWYTHPIHFHHFDYAANGISVPGIVRMMKAAEDGLIIGTDRAIYAYNGEKLDMLADYGVVYGWHASRLGGELLFWSLRGLCSALPFRNLTEDRLSVAPGSSAGAMVLEKDGMRRYVVALKKDGTAYNRR